MALSDRVEVMQFPEFIAARADVMMGKPCLKGTRIPVYLILEELAAVEDERCVAHHPRVGGPRHDQEGKRRRDDETKPYHEPIGQLSPSSAA